MIATIVEIFRVKKSTLTTMKFIRIFYLVVKSNAISYNFMCFSKVLSSGIFFKYGTYQLFDDTWTLEKRQQFHISFPFRYGFRLPFVYFSSFRFASLCVRFTFFVHHCSVNFFFFFMHVRSHHCFKEQM